MLWPLSVVLVANTNGRLAIPALAGLLVMVRYKSANLLKPKRLLSTQFRNIVATNVSVIKVYRIFITTSRHESARLS